MGLFYKIELSSGNTDANNEALPTLNSSIDHPESSMDISQTFRWKEWHSYFVLERKSSSSLRPERMVQPA
jgi:hypothetical protein